MPNQEDIPNRSQTHIPEFNGETGLEVGGPALIGAMIGSLLGPPGFYAGIVLGTLFGTKNAWRNGVKRANR